MPVPAPVTMATLAGSVPPASGTGPEPALLSIVFGEHDRRLAVLPHVPSTHARRVERHHHVAVRVEAYHAAFAANRLQFSLDDGVGRGLDRHVGVLDARADVVRDGVADPEFADAGGRDGAALIVRVGAGADDRRVADTAEALVGQPAGRGAGCEVAVLVERHRADRAVMVLGLRRLLLFGCQLVLQRFPGAVRVEIFLIDEV